MVLGVSTESSAIQGGIGCCKVSINELETASYKLKINYQKIGSGGWQDQKYAALGDIVEECCSALIKPVEELQECMKKLNELLDAVQEYESMGL